MLLTLPGRTGGILPDWIVRDRRGKVRLEYIQHLGKAETILIYLFEKDR